MTALGETSANRYQGFVTSGARSDERELERIRSIFFDRAAFEPDIKTGDAEAAVHVGFLDKQQMRALNMQGIELNASVVCCALAFDRNGAVIATAILPQDVIDQTREMQADEKWDARRQAGIGLLSRQLDSEEQEFPAL